MTLYKGQKNVGDAEYLLCASATLHIYTDLRLKVHSLTDTSNSHAVGAIIVSLQVREMGA